MFELIIWINKEKFWANANKLPSIYRNGKSWGVGNFAEIFVNDLYWTTTYVDRMNRSGRINEITFAETIYL